MIDVVAAGIPADTVAARIDLVQPTALAGQGTGIGIVNCCERTIAEDQAMTDIVAVNPNSDNDTVIIDTI